MDEWKPGPGNGDADVGLPKSDRTVGALPVLPHEDLLDAAERLSSVFRVLEEWASSEGRSGVTPKAAADGRQKAALQKPALPGARAEYAGKRPSAGTRRQR